MLMTLSGKGTAYIEETSSKELHSVRDWLVDSKVLLYLGKTESIYPGICLWKVYFWTRLSN